MLNGCKMLLNLKKSHPSASTPNKSKEPEIHPQMQTLAWVYATTKNTQSDNKVYQNAVLAF